MPRNYRLEYDRYQGKPSQIRRRSQRNKARRKLAKAGKVHKGDGKDVNHKKGLSNSRSNLNVQSKSKNRSFPRTGKARKR